MEKTAPWGSSQASSCCDFQKQASRKTAIVSAFLMM